MTQGEQIKLEIERVIRMYLATGDSMYLSMLEELI